MKKVLICLLALPILSSTVAICSALNYIGGDVFDLSTVSRKLVQKHEDEIKTLFEQAFEDEPDKLSGAMCTLNWMTQDGRVSQGLDRAFSVDLIGYIYEANI